MILKVIEQCMLPKLGKNYDECEHHQEYELSNRRLDEHLPSLLTALQNIDLKTNSDAAPNVLGLIYILYNELLTKGPWHSEKLEEYAAKLNSNCELLFEVEAKNILKGKSNFNKQLIFDECLQILHLKVTSKEFKKYPSLIEVYCLMVADIQHYEDISVNATVIPISLYLIDDYIVSNKIKGLKCCKTILEHLGPATFNESNYYEVIFASLKKVFMERNLEITKLVTPCITTLMSILPQENKFRISLSTKLYANVLNELHTESNLYRKAELFKFTKQLIEIIGINSVNRRMFHVAVCDGLDISCNEDVEEIVLVPVIECLEEWTKHCWGGWNFNTGKSTLSMLFKVLYTCNECNVEKIVKIIATLILLCSKEERRNIVQNLQNPEVVSNDYLTRINMVKKYVE